MYMCLFTDFKASLFGLMIIVTISCSPEQKKEIIWGERDITWDDFKPVKSIDNGHSSIIGTNIRCPLLISKEDPYVYAYMDTSVSIKNIEHELDTNLLIHEQYHFHITEYKTRLLRKSIVLEGKDKLTPDKTRELYFLFHSGINELGAEYDSISDHSLDVYNQVLFEIKIDSLLQETEEYSNINIYEYPKFFECTSDSIEAN